MDERETPAGAFARKMPPKRKIAIDEQTGEKYMFSGRGERLSVFHKVMCSFLPASLCMRPCSAAGVHPAGIISSIILSIVSCGTALGLPSRGRSRRLSRPPSSYRLSQLWAHLSDCMRSAAVSPMPFLRTRTTSVIPDVLTEPRDLAVARAEL